MTTAGDKKIKDRTHGRIIGNFLSLSTLEVVNYIMPLFTLPYLVRVLGPGKFGIVAFAQALIAYLVILTDYGYYLAGPKYISINRNNVEKISQIFSRIFVLKTIFMCLSFLLLIGILLVFERFWSDKWLYIFAFGSVLGDVLFPTWFFQGMERMKYITGLYLIAKSFFLVSIFIFIRTQEHYTYVPLLNSLGLIIVGIISLIIIRRIFRVRFILPRFDDLKKELVTGWHYFVSTISISLYTHSGVFILGLVASDVFVGYYSAAEKLIRAVQRLLWAGSQSIYPYINKLATESKNMALSLLRKISFIFVAGFFVVSVLIYLLAEVFVKIVLGPQYLESVIVLKILSVLPLIISISNIFGIQTMFAFNLKRVFSRILFFAALLNILLAFIFAVFYKHIGVSIAVVLTELFVASVSFFYVKNRGLNVWLSSYKSE